MDLKDYLIEQNMPRADFASRVNVTKSAVDHWVTGRRLPSKEIMPDIAVVTDGKVTANDFYGIPSQPRSEELSG